MYFFSFWGGKSPLDTPFCLFNGKRFIIILATASKIEKVGGIDTRKANIALEMNNAFVSFSGGHISPSDTRWSLTSSYSTRGGRKQSWICPYLSLVPFMLGLIKGNVTKYIMTSVNLWLFLECASRLEHVNKYSWHVFKVNMTSFTYMTNASYLMEGWGQHSPTLLQGAKLNDSLGPRVCASWIRPWYLRELIIREWVPISRHIALHYKYLIHPPPIGPQCSVIPVMKKFTFN